VVEGIPQAERIGKLVRLLSSDKSGEVLAAVAAIQRIANLHDIAECIERNWREPVIDLFGKRESKLKPWQAFAAELLQHREVLLGTRELDFLQNMRRSRTAPTAAQEKWLGDIAARRRAA
jgi:hypothetical protein